MDYYKILEIEAKTATHESIANAFRKLALKYHPIRSRENVDSNQREFNKVCEAYEVLSDPSFKIIFDKNGMDGLKNGTTKKKDGKFIGGYNFNGDSFAIFKKFFGTENPFTDNFQGIDPSTLANDSSDKNAPKDIEVCLACTIHEFYNGSLKTFTYMRDRILPDGRSIEQVEEQ